MGENFKNKKIKKQNTKTPELQLNCFWDLAMIALLPENPKPRLEKTLLHFYWKWILESIETISNSFTYTKKAK